jgi:AraC-like DNA-binding protein
MKKVSQIPVHRLEQRGKSNFEINKIEHGVIDLNYYNSIDEHRDDYYVFVYQESGTSNITVDFEELNVSGRYIFCVQPGQVHFGNFTQNTSAWVIAVASEWVPAESRFFLMETGISNQPVNINSETEALLFQHTLHLLHTFEKRNAAEQILKSMFDVYHQLFIQTYQKTINTQPKKNSRPGQITRQFKSLLLSNYRIMKSPAEYAASLNITPAYLNEVVKGTTGYPVSHWIHQEIILEAKRELYYTNNTVKEIAYSLGYADTAYFIRLFKKNAGVSPLHFRQKYHK